MIIEAENGPNDRKDATICKSPAVADELKTEQSDGGERKKVLTFSEGLNTTVVLPRFEDYTEEEQSEMWYTTANIEGFRKQYRKQGKKIRKRFSGFVDAIEEIYLTAEDISGDLYDETDFFDELKQLDFDLTADKSWCMQEDFRGLEKVASTILKNHRRERIKAIISTVKSWCMQEDLRGLEKVASTILRNRRAQIKSCISTLVFASTYSSPDSICNRYQEVSRTSKLFARILGQADSTGLAESDEEQEESRDAKNSFIESEAISWQRS